jgi:hypothetical protein
MWGAILAIRLLKAFAMTPVLLSALRPRAEGVLQINT